MANYLRVEAGTRYRQCLLRVIGELDLVTALSSLTEPTRR
jgi:hypothetical protein